MAIAGSGTREPRFTIVSAVYNVSAYLADFIASLEDQESGLDDVEVILVDDGSTDDSLEIITAWQARRPDLVTVLTKANGGQASARNLGLDHARGEWVTFTDPDDMLKPDVLSEIEKFLAEHPETQLVALNRVLYMDATGREARHPLHGHFGRANLLRNLDEHPSFFYGSAPCAFFRREVIEANGLRFSETIRPNFEDGYFCDSYLLSVPQPQVGFLYTGVYLYRKRADGTSTLMRARSDPGRYTTVLEHGYLALLRECQDRLGYVPEWVQNHIVYELSWLFSHEEGAAQTESGVVGPVAQEFHRLLAQIAQFLEPTVVLGFDLRTLKPLWREILLHGYADEPWHTPYVVVNKLDRQQRTMRVVYRFLGPAPVEEMVLNGVVTAPLWSKVRSLHYFDRTVMRERIVWMPYGSLRVRLDGVAVTVRTEEPDRPSFTAHGWALWKALGPTKVLSQAVGPRSAADRALLKLASSRPVRRLFRNAWVLIDRLHDSDDSAEHLFRYLRKNRRSVNAWFVIEKGTPDYARLRADGYKRIVAHGSLQWKLLMLNCTHLISSHADAAIMRPREIVSLAPSTWRFTFLQHGVIKDDLSSWLNPKDLDLFVVSTQDEYRSVVEDDTSYRYTGRETILTGLPRFDQVRAVGEKFPPDRRDLILIAPTWRTWLVSGVSAGSQHRHGDVDRFLESEFAKNWLALLTDARLAEAAVRHGLTVGVLMHPNLQMYTPHLGLPAGIKLFDFSGDVRELFARSRVVVTDYSSMAFNAAYIERPVAYFQFDRDRMFGGGHVGRQGYFRYERNGFGPVVDTPDAAIDAAIDAIEFGPQPRPEYLKRVMDAFPLRDGKCSERVFEAIRDSTNRVGGVFASLPAPPADAVATRRLASGEVDHDDSLDAADPFDGQDQDEIGMAGPPPVDPDAEPGHYADGVDASAKAVFGKFSSDTDT
ncbi:MAG: glycosyltransferase [Jatrophihabitans sp.]